MQIRFFGYMRIAKAQISLRTRAVWLKTSLSANRISGYYRMYEWRAKGEMILDHVQDDPNMRILRMFEGTLSLDAAHLL